MKQDDSWWAIPEGFVRRVANLALLILILTSFLPVSARASAPAQAPVATRQPLDVMLVIDNSGSMFPPEQTCAGCEAGNDPKFLRLTGASLFIAGLGLGESNSKDYQIGVISLGDEKPELISSLRSAPDVRDILAKAISAPMPKNTTYLVPALKMAYSQLKDSPQRRAGNQPAVVLLTDGVPYPAQGQNETDIRKLVESYPDVPVFFILLQNPEKRNEALEGYTRFWEGMQRQYGPVRTYRAKDTSEITTVFDEIIARLQNSISEPGGGVVSPEKPVNIYVSRYVQSISIKVIHERGKPKADVTITDPKGVAVRSDDPQVEWFRGNDNQVETISIGSARLARAPYNDIWTIRSSALVSYQLVRTGAYDFQFEQPQISRTLVNGQYLALNRFSPSKPYIVRFKLLLNGGSEAVTEPQEISGRVLRPDGTTKELRIPADIKPNSDGVYEIAHDFVADFPAAAKSPGRFMLTLDAGLNDPKSSIRVPIARADLLVDVGRVADFDKITPDPLICGVGQSANLSVMLRDMDVAKPETVRVRAYYGSGRDMELKSTSGNVLSAPVDELCKALLVNLACSQKREEKVRIRLVSENRDGAAAPPAEVPLSVQLIAPLCTPTPTHTPVPPTPRPPPTATPVPTATPIPNSDQDPPNDLVDKCPTQTEWKIAPWFNGCPPPIWVLALAGLVLLGLLAFLGLYLIPLLLTMTVSPPPSGYLLICRDNKPQGSPRSLRDAGIGARSSTVTIGSKGDIRVTGLAPVELCVMRRGKEAVVMDGAKGSQKFTIVDIPNSINISNTNIILKFGTDASKLRC
jgi:hypothetical protein